MKLGFILEPGARNSIYRVVLPMHAMEHRGHTVVWPSRLSDDIPMDELLRCDLVHVFRRYDRLRDLKHLSERGVAVSVDNDDDYQAAEMALEHTGVKGRLDNQKRFARSLDAARIADLMTTPSEVLANKYRARGASHVTVIENYLDGRAFAYGMKVKHDGLVIGWIAQREHTVDLERLPIASALSRLLEGHPELRVLCVGVPIPLRSDRYEHIHEVNFDQLTRTAGQIDIGIAPLANTEFNRSRSNVKLKEYGAGGATWLASPVGAYSELGPKQGGQLVADDEWFDALDRLIRHPFKRKRLSRNAQKWAKAQTIDHNARTWEDEFLQAIDRAAERIAHRRKPNRTEHRGAA